jgi:hypothetical protein
VTYSIKIHIPTYGAGTAIEFFICNTLVIWVDGETHILEGTRVQFLPEEC